jgi:Zn-dependent protease
MPDAIVCGACGTEVAPGLLACPGCHKLVHGDRLKELAFAADASQRVGDLTASLVGWREALELLPQGSKQYSAVAERIAEVGRLVEQNGPSIAVAPAQSSGHGPARAAANGSANSTATVQDPSGSKQTGSRAGLAGAGAGLLFLLTKGKFLLLGLTKASTFLSMMAAAGVYWTVFGWPLAIGLVLSIYVHEMGHVFVLSRYGIRAGAPLFVPGLGAVIMARQVITDPRQDARVGLAGPVWGLGTALAFLGAGLALEFPLLLAIAKLGALINLFNLLPVWSLDGGRAFRSLTKSQRLLATAATALAWSLTQDPLLFILTAAGAWRALAQRGAVYPDRGTLVTYVVLLAALSALTLLPVPI